MAARQPDQCGGSKPRVRAMVWIALAVSAIAVGTSLIGSAGLYANLYLSPHRNPLLPFRISGPYPDLAVLGIAALNVGVVLIVLGIGLALVALLLGAWRPPRISNCVIAVAALLVCGLAGGIVGAAIQRFRNNSIRDGAEAAGGIMPIIQRYADEHEGSLPPVATWAQTLSFFDTDAADVLAYPIQYRELNGFSTLALNANVEDRKLAALPADMVLLFPTEPTTDPVGGRELLVSYARTRRGVAIAFADLHVECVTRADIENLRWDP